MKIACHYAVKGQHLGDMKPLPIRIKTVEIKVSPEYPGNFFRFATHEIFVCQGDAAEQIIRKACQCLLQDALCIGMFAEPLVRDVQEVVELGLIRVLLDQRFQGSGGLPGILDRKSVV